MSEESKLEECLNSPEFKESVRKVFDGIRKLMDECRQNGHKSSGTALINYFLGNMSAHDYCTHCKMSYQRNPTAKEYKNFQDLMNKPIY